MRRFLPSLFLWLFLTGPLHAQDSFAAFQAAAQHLEQSFNDGDYPGAEAIGLAALDLGRQELGETAQDVLRLQGRLAAVIEAQGRRMEALDLMRDAWEKWRANYLQYNPYRQLAQMEYARLLGEMGGVAEALPLALESLRFAETMWGRGADVTTVWRWNVAGLYERLGYQDEALATYLETLDYYRQSDTSKADRRAAITAQSIAATYSQRGQYDTADVYWREAMDRFAATHGPDHPRRLDAALMYALHAYTMGRHDEEAALLDEIEPRIVRVFGRQSVQMYTLLENRALLIATTAAQRGGDEVQRAAAMLGEAAEGFAGLLGEKSDKAGHAWLNLSPMLAELGDRAGALDAALRAERAGNGSRSTLYNAIYHAADQGVLTHRDAVAEVLRISQVGYSNVFKQAAKMQGARLELRGGPAEAAYRELTDRVAEEEAMQERLLQIASLPADERDGVAETELRATLADNGARIQHLIDFIADKEPAGAAMIGDAVITLDDIQALLGSDEVLVIVDVPRAVDDDADIIAISRDEVGWWLAGATQADMRAAAADVRASIDLRFGVRAAQSLAQTADTPRDAFNTYAAYFLYDSTFGRAEEMLRGKTHVYVDLRGPLSGLPPHLLVKEMPPEGAGAEDIHWMVRHHAITVIPSPFALKVAELARDTTRDRRQLLAFADPDFGAPPEGTVAVAALEAGQGALRGALAPLPETREEVRAVARALGTDTSTVLEGQAATEAAVKAAALADFRVLYFATHGLVAGDLVRGGELAEPALALTAGGGDDGLLTQSEVAGLTLDADMVVLSACNTAVGGEPGAEALSGLAQAFAYAGARSLMVSHWPVESRSAVALMSDMFARRAADPTLGPAEAQRQAILHMLDAPERPEWRHPAYWAPFVLVGSSE